MKDSIPITKINLKTDLTNLGIKPGMVLIVHSSLKSIGWVLGGAVTVVQALMETVSSEGTLLMPTHSSDYSDPEPWQNPPAPAHTWSMIRENMPTFDPQITPSKNMGHIPEVFRTFPNTYRSYHPTVSFCAWGKHAESICSKHQLAYSLGEHSPLAKIYELNGHVLLLGVGYDKNTSFHLAEYRQELPKKIQCGSPIFENGKRIWKTYEDIDLNDKPFAELGKQFELNNRIVTGLIGQSPTKLFSQRSSVDYAINYLKDKTEVL